MKTGTANNSGPQSENGPSSLNDSEGRRNTPEPTTALMHMATSPQNPTVRMSLGEPVACIEWRAACSGNKGDRKAESEDRQEAYAEMSPVHWVQLHPTGPFGPAELKEKGRSKSLPKAQFPLYSGAPEGKREI